MAILVRIEGVVMAEISDLIPHPKNPNSHSREQIERLAKILEYQGWRYPIKVSNRSGYITSGHGRLDAAKKLKLKQVPVSYQDYDTDEQEYADIVSDNAIAEWSDLDLSSINASLPDLGPDFDIDMLGIKDFGLDPEPTQEDPAKLADKFLEPPFSVLNARAGGWQDRKRQWIAIGIQSELGRGG